MPSCVMRFCTNYSSKMSKSQGITYHLFPLNVLKRDEWVKIVRQQRREDDWMPTKYSKICSNHFKYDDKDKSKKGYTVLKKGAVPIIKEENRLSPLNTPPSPGSPNSLQEEHLEGPRKSALKLRVRKLIIDKRNLINKNNILIFKNKRLLNKVENMSMILNILKKNKLISDEQLAELNLKPEAISLFSRLT
ncbi:unnamed protein product [Colias eurytheme]|nr:unnamed protein product [Colias eurytheme]